MRTALTWSLAAMALVVSHARAQEADVAEQASDAAVNEAGAEPQEAPETQAVEAATPTEPSEEARIRFELGNTLYEQGRFADALVQFRAAYDMTGNAQMLHNMYLCERDQGNLREAAGYLERYLHEEPSVPNRPLLDGRLEALRAQVAEQEERTVTTARQEPSRAGPILFFSIGGAALLAAGGLAANVASLNGDLRDECFGGVCPERYDDDRASLRRRAITVDSLWIGALALAAVGAVWWVVGSAGSEDAAVSCGPMGCSIEGAF